MEMIGFKREQLEKDFIILGFAFFDNKVKESSILTLKLLKEANVECKMITGDNLMTACEVARQIDLVNETPALSGDQFVEIRNSYRDTGNQEFQL